MLKNSVDRSKGRFTPIPASERKKAYRKNCQCCGSRYGQIRCWDDKESAFMAVRQVLDHMIPRRWLSEHGIYEHDHRGLLSICTRCHGRKKKLEDRLYQGDTLSFMEGLKAIGYPLDKLLRFVSLIGIKELDGWNLNEKG